MSVGIIGCGLMGQQRANGIAALGRSVAAVYDPDPAKARSVAEKMSAHVEGSLDTLLAVSNIDAVVVAVPHFLTRDITTQCLAAGKHVLCEKPLGMNVRECDEILSAARSTNKVLAAGFNYRYYPGVVKLKELIAAGEVGEVTHMRFILGHGARPGYENEWKTSKALCGGGALLDPGIHILDLISYLAGRITKVSASLFRSFWNIDVEDNAVLLCETETGCRIQAHISITEWKSRMSIDVFGTDGSAQLTGRSGFYGAQMVRRTRRWAWLQNPPAEESVFEFAAEDISFREELRQFFDLIEGRQATALARGEDGRRALEVVERVYDECERAGGGSGWVSIPNDAARLTGPAVSQAVAVASAGASPLVSLIVCTMRRPERLEPLLESLRAQTHRHIEVLIVGTADNAASYGALVNSEKRLKYFTSTPRGLARARNVGLENASGDIVGFLDDDVEFGPDFIEKAVEAFERPELRDCGGITAYDLLGYPQPLTLRWKLRRWLGTAPSLRPGDADHLGRHVPLCFLKPFTGFFDVKWLPGFCQIYRREALEGVWCDEDIVGGEDRDLALQVGRRWRMVLWGDWHIKHHRDEQGRFSQVPEVRRSAYGLGRSFAKRLSSMRDWFTVIRFFAAELVLDLAAAVKRPSAANWRVAVVRQHEMLSGFLSVPRSEAQR
jgi:predicted dehydrogenase/glycosyltransferase involved in cell wall biosynthesis